jgi:predicted GIY-YIG superfamily endonuclease
MNLNDTFPKEPGVYLIQDGITGKAYVGSTGNLNNRLSIHLCELRNNKHYNKELQNLYNANPDLSVAALPLENKETAYEFEQAILDDFYDSGLLTNKAKFVKQSAKDLPVSDATREKISQANKGKQFRLGMVHTDDTKAKMSTTHLKRHESYVVSEETKRKRKESMKDYVISDETREKLRQTSTGRTLSDESRKKLSNSRLGIVFTDEHKAKLSEAKKFPVVINGVTYINAQIAANELNVTKRIVQHRCSSDNFPNWNKISLTL